MIEITKAPPAQLRGLMFVADVTERKKDVFKLRLNVLGDMILSAVCAIDRLHHAVSQRHQEGE